MRLINFESNVLISGSLREKFEYSHADEAALSALFEEFGSSKFTYFEGRSSGAAGVGESLMMILFSIIMILVR